MSKGFGIQPYRAIIDGQEIEVCCAPRMLLTPGRITRYHPIGEARPGRCCHDALDAVKAAHHAEMIAERQRD